MRTTHDPSLAADAREIAARYAGRRSDLIQILQDVQERHGYLSEAAIGAVSRALRVSENTIYGVATFYAQFRLQRPGRCRIEICLGTACHVKGGRALMELTGRRLGLRPGETSGDGEFSLERVACLGCCALAPVVVVDGRVQARMTSRAIQRIIARERGGPRT